MTKSYYAKKRIEGVKERNALNRQRAAAMERNVATFLLGSRVPSSGASWMKGDVRVKSATWGEILVECKLSSMIHTVHGPLLVIQDRWLEKIENDFRAMKCAFGILVIRFHGQLGNGYAVLPKAVFDQIHVGEYTVRQVPIKKKSYYAYKVHMPDEHAAEYVELLFNRGSYIVYPLVQFRDDFHAEVKELV